MSMNYHEMNESYSDYDYGHANPHVCENRSGFYTKNSYGVVYTWNGLPVHSNINDGLNYYVAGTQILFGIFGICLNGFCGRVIIKNPLPSWAVKYYLLIDCYCRFNESMFELYKAYCVLTWQCVSETGWLVPGILINKIVTASNMGMVYGMQMIGNGLCFNRVFAVFFNGKYYSRIEGLALPHGLVLWAFPLAVYYYMIGDRTSVDNDFVCHGGWYWTPLEYCTSLFYTWNPIVEWLSLNWGKVMYGVLLTTLSMDLLTLWKVRQLKNHSEAMNRANFRLSIMLVTTHFITVCFLLSDYIVNYVFSAGFPIYFFVLLECVPFVDHCLLSCIVISFNLPPKKKVRMARVINGPVTNTNETTLRHQSISERQSTHVKIN